ncbi:MAG TPA: acyltransferase [Pyrinomonadaceae bacterium]|nr:acyltransferase [Pyrinomonadaceae bacterium]
MTPTRSLEPSRLRSIDALRGIAAMGVVVYHCLGQSPHLLPNNFLAYPVKLLQLASSFGYIGVFLFFVISGFCIHLQWARVQASGVKPTIEFGAFWKRRIRRLYPPYIIAFALYLLLTAWSVGIDVSHFFIYDVLMHLLMLHNLDPHTCYSINGVFWTLAIEEQLYLAYFVLLFLRRRWGWTTTLIVCLGARLAWMIFSHVVWRQTGVGIPVPEAAASHWFTWALGAIGVEAMFGLIQLPRWLKNLWFAGILVVAASALSHFLPGIPKDTPWHNVSWFLIHPMWGLGFFMIVNRAVIAEREWIKKITMPTLVTAFATIGVFSYSIYLTHELVIMQSWRYVEAWLPPIANILVLTIPATIIFAWVFFWFCERPFMRKRAIQKEDVAVQKEEPQKDRPQEITPITQLEPESA